MNKVKVVMLFLQLFVSNILIVLVSGCTYTESTIFTDIKPFYYKLDLRIPKSAENDAFSGESRINIHIEQNMHTISFHSLVSIDEILLQSIYANKETIREPSVQKRINKTYKPRNIYHYELGIVMLYFDEMIRCGYYMLQIKFRKIFTTKMDGFIRTLCCPDKNDKLQWMIAIYSGVKGPQAVFPCWDDPNFTIVFDVSVLHPRSHFVYSNSQGFMSNDEDDLNMWRTNFYPTLPISSHCITIFILPRSMTQKYNKLRLHNDVIVWKKKAVLSEDPHIFDFAWDITLNVTKILKTEIPLVDYCNVIETHYIPIESFYFHEIVVTPTYVLYRDNNIILLNNSNINQKEKVARFLAEQITYQWMLRSGNPFDWPSSRFQEMSKLLGMCIYYRYPEVFKEFQRINWIKQSKHEYLYNPSADFDMDDEMEYEIIKETTHFLCNFYIADFAITYFRK